MSSSAKQSPLVFLCCSAQAALEKFHSAAREKTGNAWKEWELDILRENYESLGIVPCHNLLPHRTQHSIYHKANRMGLVNRSIRKWTQPELDLIIKSVNRDQSISETQTLLASKGYDRTYYAVRDCQILIRKRYFSPEPIPAVM